jgi:hypothetical protein
MKKSILSIVTFSFVACCIAIGSATIYTNAEPATPSPVQQPQITAQSWV